MRCRTGPGKWRRRSSRGSWCRCRVGTCMREAVRNRPCSDNKLGSLRCHEHDVDFRHGRNVGGSLDAGKHAASGGLHEALQRDKAGRHVGEGANIDTRGAVELAWAGQELHAGAEDCLQRIEPAVEAQAADPLGGRNLRLLVVAGEHAVPGANVVGKR